MERKFGPYTLIHQIAVGGMAEIHLARTEGIAGFEKYVAIKMIHPNFSEDQQFVQMLIDEAKITVQLAHVNIAQTFDLGRVGNTYYSPMEFVEGCDLYKLLREGSELDIDVPIDVAAHIVKEAATGLDYAHRKRDVMGSPLKIVHRDVSPQNLLVSSMGEVKVIDFGIAKASMRAQETQAGVIKGKYYYMSPEQAWGEHLDARTDIFSLGIILYELLTGQMLYLEEDLHVLLDRIREAKIESPNALRRGIPPELEEIVMRALQKRPNDRFSTAAEMAQALERFLRNYSPVCGANTVTQWTKSVLGDADVAAEEENSPSMDERDMRALTQGIGSEQLLNTGDDFSDENSIIFRASEVDERMRAAEAENEELDDRDIDQETGVVDPSTPPPGYSDRDITDETHALTSRAPTLGDNTPLPELFPFEGEEGEEGTVVSGPPGFGGDMPAMGRIDAPTTPRTAPIKPRQPATRQPAAIKPAAIKPAARQPAAAAPKPSLGASKFRPVATAIDDFDAEQTLAHSSSSAKLAVPPKREPAPAADETTGEKTMAAGQPGPFRKSNALNTSNPKPAVSVLKPPRKSRRTPPKGVAAQGQPQSPGPNSVLSHLITNSSNRAQVALGANPTPSSIAVPLHAQHGQAPIIPKQPGQHPLGSQQAPQGQNPQGQNQQGQNQQGQDQQGQPHQYQGQQQYQQPYQGQQQYQQPGMPQQYQQPGMPAPYMQQPGMPAPYMQQPGGFPHMPGLATNARMAAYDVDELPDAYILTNRKSKAKWLLPALGFLILAIGAAAATYFLLTQDKESDGQSATLMVVSTPEGASVTVNGSLLTGKTPTSYSNANVGDTLQVVVDLKGHRKWESETTIKTPDDKLIARLDPILVNLTVTSEPAGAEIYLNGNASAAGRTPKTFSDIDPATATSIVIKKDGFREERRNLDWTKDVKKEVPFNLKP
jgi:serine/threonine protein kinase